MFNTPTLGADVKDNLSTSRKLLSHDDLKALGITYSKPHLWRLVRKNKFPKPVKLGQGRNAWLEREIDAWVAARVAERDQAAA